MGVALSFVHDLQFDAIPDDVIAASIRSLTDTLGAAVAGSTTKLSSIIRDHAAEQFSSGGSHPASLWSDGRKVSPAGAALANGMTIDSVDAHDGQKLTKGHVGCGVVPALLALVEATEKTDARELLAALVMAYEIGSRAGIALHGTVSDYHTSGAWIALASACVGARYLGLDPQQTRHAFGIAEYHGPRSQMMRTIDHPTMVKDGSGWGSMACISAAFMARDGFTGAPAITMEEEQVASIWADLGTRWYMKEQYIKLYPVCRWAQPPVEAVLELKSRHGFGTQDIAAIEVRTFHEARRLQTRYPKTTEEAQYSLPFSVATALVHGTIGPQHISGEALCDPECNRLQGLIEIHETDAFNEAFPGNRIASVSVRLHDGQILTSPATEARGDPENPVSEVDIVDKFLSFTRPVLGNDRADALLATIAELPNEGSAQPLIDALAGSQRS